MAKSKDVGIDKEQLLLENAVTWVLQEGGDANCPFCPWSPQAGASPNALKDHIQSAHPFKAILAHQQRDLEPIQDTLTDEQMQDRSIQERLGIESQEELDRPNYLFVPPSIKEKLRQENAKGRWVSRAKLEQHLARGAILVERGKEEMPYQASTEDTQVRANEMIYVKYPERVWKQRADRQRRLADNNLHARAEEMRKNKERSEKQYFETLLREGYDRNTAEQVSKALARGQRRKGLLHGSRDAHLGIVVRDKDGAKQY